MQNLEAKLQEIPQKPGIYKFLDDKGEIMYVGKAINLRSRVRSYFSSDLADRPWVAQMIPLIADIQTIPTANEIEALIFEANLIKEHQPKFNSALKDGKSYAWIHIDMRKPFPMVKKTREIGNTGRYFGPYPDGRPINRMLRYLRRVYPFADCKLKFYPQRDPAKVKNKRVCLYYHLGQCTGPCDNVVTSDQYKENIRNIIKTLEGKKKDHIKDLEEEMIKLAKEEKFEEAAALRDKVKDLQYLSQRIDIGVGDTETEYREIQQARYLAGIKEAIEKLSLEIPDVEIKRVRMECYDISNILGENAYGSMTVSLGARTDSSQYRIFKIKTVEGADDPAMLREVIERRLKYFSVLRTEVDRKEESLLRRPQIIVLDGAKSQLSAVFEYIKSVLPSVGILGISKGKRLKRAGEKQVDEFWTMKNGRFVTLKFSNPFIFQALRDEAHRFAIKHYRNAKKYSQKVSLLDSVRGIGPKTKKALVQKFGSVKGISAASREDISQIVKNEKVLDRLMAALTEKQKSSAS